MNMNKICVYAICKNESKFISKWLNSMQEADYIVVLDTGSTDGTFEQLKADSRVTRIEQKIIDPWRFDVARNESMKLCPEDANILICTDFDELLTEGWAEELRSKWQEGTTRGFYKYAWSHNAAGEPTDVFTYDKIHDHNYYWKFPVHEVLWRDDGANQVGVHLDFMLHHYPDSEKPRSYMPLLLLAKEENPDSPHIQNLLAREYAIQKDYSRAVEEFDKLLEMPNSVTEEFKLNRYMAFLTNGEIYAASGEYTKALDYFNRFIKEDSTYREPYLYLGEIYNSMKLPKLAIGAVEQALAVCTRKYDWVEGKNSWLGRPEDILSVSYSLLEDFDRSIEYGREALRHDPNDVRLLKNMNYYLSKQLEKLTNKQKRV